MSGDINMQKDQVTTIGNNVTDLGTAVQQMASYSKDGLTADHFGGVEGASDAGALFVQTVNALGASVGKAANFLNSAGQTITKSVAATSLADEENMWGVNKAGGNS